ncbi:MAG TPA: cupin domain-containing protein, partial [Planctomycetota bacterium]|nr:cupin domain-containing protein [Planctomycetota bacterium]
PFLIEIPPQRDIDLEHSAHPGEEFIFVLSGELAARIGDAEYRLGRGDSVYFDSRVDHVLRAEGAQPVRLLACFVGVTRDFAGNPLERAFQLREGSGPKKRKPQDGGPSS